MAYDPVKTARDLTLPMLILQGGRDYQVTMEDFRGWEEGLTGQDRVYFKFYPDLNHLFISGTGKSTSAEYKKPGNVAQVVIKDIAEWAKANQIEFQATSPNMSFAAHFVHPNCLRQFLLSAKRYMEFRTAPLKRKVFYIISNLT